MQRLIFSTILLSILISSFVIDVDDHTNGRGGRLGVRDAIIKYNDDKPGYEVSMHDV